MQAIFKGALVFAGVYIIAYTPLMRTGFGRDILFFVWMLVGLAFAASVWLWASLLKSSFKNPHQRRGRMNLTALVLVLGCFVVLGAIYGPQPSRSSCDVEWSSRGSVSLC